MGPCKTSCDKRRRARVESGSSKSGAISPVLGNLGVGMGGILSDSGKQEKIREVSPQAVHADKS